MRDQEPSDGERMALEEFQIHTASRTSHLHSGTKKSQSLEAIDLARALLKSTQRVPQGTALRSLEPARQSWREH
jgi:hypothetical protein